MRLGLVTLDGKPVEQKLDEIAQQAVIEGETIPEIMRSLAKLLIEECAKVCDDRAQYYRGDDDAGVKDGRRSLACLNCAGAIRSLKESI